MSDPFHELAMPSSTTAEAAQSADTSAAHALDHALEHADAGAEAAAGTLQGDTGPSGDAGLSSGTRYRRTLLRRIAGLAVTGAALYVVAPTILSVLHSFPQLSNVDPLWFPVLFVLQVLCFAGTWILVRFALRTKRWFPIITSQLAGNAVSRVLPGGVAAGPGLQAAMLARSGYPGVLTATAMSSTGLLLTGTLLLLPLLAVPALLAGLSLPRALQFGLALSLILAVLIAAIGVLLLRTDAVLRWAARGVGFVQRRIRSRPADNAALEARLLRERDEVRSSFARNPYRALSIAAVTRLLDYATLVVALLAVGVNISPTLVLLAFVGSAALSMVPITPGGLGFVEAGLTGLLALAGVPANEALVGTLLYRLTSYWLPLPVGLLAYALWRRRAAGDRERNQEPQHQV
ncbi:MAG TPA: flippase-like domain-containing protein [Frankiaceae bacterium]|nr:flippase-like domain-containing protein [Frankiaceae bacterium]